MPELPEVETVCRTLRPILLGQTILDVTLLYPKMLNVSPATVRKNMIGQRFIDLTRIGKYIIFHLSNDVVLVSHLRMEGKYLELKTELEPLPRYARAVITLQDRRRMVYDDMRKFGTWEISTQRLYRKLPSLAPLGVEPMDVTDVGIIHHAFIRSSRPIKSLLLDQRILLGIGNIYADEILFASRMHPLTPGTRLTVKQTTTLIKHAQTILLHAIAAGGSRIRSYQPGHGIDGHFQNKIQVYGRQGLACHTCRHRIHRLTIAGRSASYCPRCQHRHDLPRVIAITGQIATGKSTLLQFAKQHGFFTLSADAIVKTIYEQKQYAASLKKIFGSHVIIDDTVQTKAILEAIVRDPIKRIALEKFIHPLVEAKILKALLTTKAAIAWIEVPLLFQANLDYLADDIILVEQPFALQAQRVVERNPGQAEQLLALNRHNHSHDYRSYADAVIVNDQSIKNLEKIFEKTIEKLGLKF